MDTFHLFLIAVIQGLTEFLPVSSSAHLVLFPALTHSPDQGLSFDVAVHVGSLIAVLFYFHRDLRSILGAWLRQGFKAQRSFEANLGWYFIIATIPAGVAGLLFHDFIDTHLRSPLVIACTSIFYGILLGAADYFSPKTRNFTQVRLRDAVWLGMAQALALVPGTSRSGVTMTAGRFLGLSREACARFSFLMSVPIILMAGLMQAITLWSAPEKVDWHPFVYGGAVSALVAFLAIHFFMKWITRIGMMPFVVYRVCLGVALLIWLAM